MVRISIPQRRFIRTILGKRQNGETVEIDEYLMTVPDRTCTGTIWEAPPHRYPVHRLRSGETVDVADDGTAIVNETGEVLIIVE